MLPESDLVRIRHMIEASQDAIGFVSGYGKKDLEDNRMLCFAVIRAIEIIGEAATKVSPETRASFPQVPWQSIAAMRNRLIHAYFGVDIDRVWETLTDDLPPLIGLLTGILHSTGTP